MHQRIKLRFLLIIVTGEQRPHGAGDAAILLGIVRYDTALAQIKIYTRYILYKQPFPVTEELAEPEDWLESIQPKLIPL